MKISHAVLLLITYDKLSDPLELEITPLGKWGKMSFHYQLGNVMIEQV
jgi:hypothetical protein